jgi:hypothetical protein
MSPAGPVLVVPDTTTCGPTRNRTGVADVRLELGFGRDKDVASEA